MNEDILGIGNLEKGNMSEAYPEVVDITSVSKQNEAVTLMNRDLTYETTPGEMATSVNTGPVNTDFNNLINAPMTRQEIVEKEEAEAAVEEEVRNHSGFFGPKDETETFQNPGPIDSASTYNQYGEAVPNDLAEQYKDFNSHGIEY